MQPHEVVSLALSVGSALVTAYFWLARNNRERPRLKVQWGALENVERNAGRADATLRLGLLLKLVVTNDSSLPNALLDARVAVKGREGAWLPEQRGRIAGRSVGPATELPLSLPALQAVVVRTWAWVEVPRPAGHANLESPQPDRPHTWEPWLSCLAGPLEVKVELRGLGGRTFTGVAARPAESIAEAPPPLC